MISEYAKKIGALDEELRLRFYENFAHELTIFFRGIWSDENLPDTEKVEQMKWINEIQHAVTAKVYEMRRKLNDWSEEDFQRLIQDYINTCKDIEPLIESAIGYSYKHAINDAR
jgi:ribosome-binding ATPase YchF (GTP1/OBG family)